MKKKKSDVVIKLVVFEYSISLLSFLPDSAELNSDQKNVNFTPLEW